MDKSIKESIQKKQFFRKGKAKTLYETNDPNYLIVEFRDDITAFNAKKVDKLAGRGLVNNYFNTFIMTYLSKAGIPTHFESHFSSHEMLVKRLNMLPLEAVIRNYAAGGLCRRLGLKSGLPFSPPIFEYFLKNDELGDPLVNESHILTFGWATLDQMKAMQVLTGRVNELLTALFSTVDLSFIDCKLEFGVFEGQLYLGDEFTPDACRLWDKATGKNFDKDRFRQDQGDVVASYKVVAERLGIVIP